MALLKHLRKRNGWILVDWSFHEWKFMALLKPKHRGRNNKLCHRFHEWKFMALLKLKRINLQVGKSGVSMNENSWLYWSVIKWPTKKSLMRVSMNENSWLYWSGKKGLMIILAGLSFHEWKFMALLKPWMEVFYVVRFHRVSMNENSWLYWSIASEITANARLYKFPWMKIHGSIEAIPISA